MTSAFASTPTIAGGAANLESDDRSREGIAVADKLKVDVDGLFRGGSDIGEQASILSGSHVQSMVGLSDSESGWVGSSADALVRMADTWQRVADKHHTALTEQAAHVVDAGKGFRAMDEHGATELGQLDDRADGV
ncbi:hypothetical protein GCM10010533_11630 [Mycolicibacterium pallens]